MLERERRVELPVEDELALAERKTNCIDQDEIRLLRRKKVHVCFVAMCSIGCVNLLAEGDRSRELFLNSHRTNMNEIANIRQAFFYKFKCAVHTEVPGGA